VPNASPGSPGACSSIAGNVCTQQWQTGDFDVSLTRQQPTIWRVSTGRVNNPFLPSGIACDDPTNSCPGFLGGQVQPAPTIPSAVLTSGGDGRPHRRRDRQLEGRGDVETIGSPQISESTIRSTSRRATNLHGRGCPPPQWGRVQRNPPAVEVPTAVSAQDLVADALTPPSVIPWKAAVQLEITPAPPERLQRNGGR
jgi:hypothetical protein